MLPLENGANEEPWTLGIDENLWLPLYFEGKGSAPVINYALSLALPPVYSDGGRTVTIKLKHYLWSDGSPVTTRDIQFFFNLYKVGEPKIATYVPGQFPDNIRSIDYKNSTTFRASPHSGLQPAMVYGQPTGQHCPHAAAGLGPRELRWTGGEF